MLVFVKCQQQRFDSLRIILESDRETMTKFDFLASLLDFGLGVGVDLDRQVCMRRPAGSGVRRWSSMHDSVEQPGGHVFVHASTPHPS